LKKKNPSSFSSYRSRTRRVDARRERAPFRPPAAHAQLPLLLPSVTYRCDCDVESIDEAGASDMVRVYVCTPTSKVPVISAVVTMPLSEVIMDG